MTCQKCSHINSPGMKYCGSCGNPIGGANAQRNQAPQQAMPVQNQAPPTVHHVQAQSHAPPPHQGSNAAHLQATMPHANLMQNSYHQDPDLQNYVDSYLSENKGFFPKEQIPMLRIRMLEMGSTDKVLAVSGLRMKSPTFCLIIAIIPYIGWCFDRWYLRQYWLGLMKALTLGGIAIWWIADMFTAKRRTREYNFNSIMNHINSFDAKSGTTLHSGRY